MNDPGKGISPLYQYGSELCSRFSYSLYLMHNSFLGLVFYLFLGGEKVMPTMGNLALAATFTLAALAYSWICYLAFEKHTTTLRKSMSTWLPLIDTFKVGQVNQD